MAAKRRRYTGELATPIVWRDPPTFEGAVTPARVKEFWRNYERHQREAEQRIAEKLLQKMTLLMKHYRIVDENLAVLAWALASQHVPGFKILPETKIKKGRKRKWDGPRLENLLHTVHSVKEQHRFTDRQALAFIVNNHQHAATWGLPSNHKGSKQAWIETLESRLQDAKRYVSYIESLPTLLKDIAAHVSRDKSRKL
jgi:hypothetical protein